MIDGTWWLVILLVVIVALWLLAKSRGESDQQEAAHSLLAKAAKKPLYKKGLQKTAALIKQDFPDYVPHCRKHHLLITKQDKKIAMITIDKSIEKGQRHLGNVPIINYHHTPSRTQLIASLQNIEVRKEDHCI